MRLRSPYRLPIAIGAALAALVLRIVMQPWLGEGMPLLFFVPAIVVAGWYGGLVPGLVATALSAVGGWLFLLTPEFPSIAGRLTEPRALILLAVIGAATSWAFELLHRAAEREEQARLEAVLHAGRFDTARTRT